MTLKKRNFLSRVSGAMGKVFKRSAAQVQWWQTWFDKFVDIASQGVNLSTAMKVATVYACVRVIAESFASLPIELMLKSSGRKNKAIKLPEYYLLKVKPNPYCNAFTFWESFLISASLTGNGYAWIERIRKGPGAGSAKNIWFLHPDQVTVYIKDREKILEVIPLFEGGVIKEKMILYPGDYLHMPVLSENGITGRSIVHLLKDSIENLRDQTIWQKLFFSQGVKPGAVLTTDNPLEEEDAKRVKEVLNASSSGENAHRAILLPFGLKWQQITMSAEDVKILEQYNLSERQICGALRVPQPMIQNHENSTYSNTEQLDGYFSKHCMRPWAERVEAMLNEQLLSKEQYLEGYYTKTNLNALQRASLESRMRSYNIGVFAGIYTRNECRDMEELDPIEGLDEPLTPLNMVAESDLEGDKNPAKDQNPKQIADKRMVKVEVIDTKGNENQLKALVSGFLEDTLKRIHSRERKEMMRNAQKLDAKEFEEWLEKFLLKHDEYFVSNVLPVARRLDLNMRCDDTELEKRVKRMSADQVVKLRSMVRVSLAEADGDWFKMPVNLDRKCKSLELGAEMTANVYLDSFTGVKASA